MCERNGTTYSKLQDLSRRGFLKTTSVVSATLALPAALGTALMSGAAHAATKIKATHGSGLCNMITFCPLHCLRVVISLDTYIIRPITVQPADRKW